MFTKIKFRSPLSLSTNEKSPSIYALAVEAKSLINFKDNKPL